MRPFLLGFTLLLCLTRAAAADRDAGPFSAADLRGMCVSSSNVDYGFCAGYISAVAHVMLSQNVGASRACNQAQVRGQQLVDTFNAWAELFPERLGDDASLGVAAALARAFPCQ